MKRLTPRQVEALRAIVEGRYFPELCREDDGWHARWRGLAEDNAWIDEYVRAAALTPLSADAEDQKHETLHDAWIMALRSRTGLVRWDDAECEAFAAELAEWSGAAAADVEARAGICFRLESGADGFRIVCDIPRGRRALRSLGQAVYVFGPLRGMHSADGATVLAVELSRAEAESFVRSGAKALVDAGYGVAGCELTATVHAEAEIADTGAAPADTGAAPADSRPALALRLRVRVVGEVVDAEELRFLLEQKSTLVFFRDRWIEVDRNILKEALRALERQDGRRLSANEAVAFASGIGFAGRLDIATARAHGWLRGLVNELKAENERSKGTGAGLLTLGAAADPIPLRPYQRRGVAWVKFLADHGFGALLADDMGLGKTIQAIAWIAGEIGAAENRAAPGRPFLVVAPLTLLANWRHEFAKFAPSLAVYVHQGESRQLEMGFRREAVKADVVITSYSLLVRDYPAIRRVEWAGMVLDEAQAIKNPDTQVARAAVSLGAPKRVALTGTPVENSVADVWSLENFLNPGFLGDRKSFADRFAKPIAATNGQSAAGRKLAHALEPFVLRRLKSDPEVAGELGEKREIKEYCVLSAEQRRDYEAALEDYRASERRQGDIFALLTRLKLVCDGDCKFERLGELLDEVFAAGESALVFTQYAKVGERVRSFLERRFSRRFPFLHGGLGAKEREAAVAEFCGTEAPSAFILSLKAGGYGLNLTKATHVVHFDRWWNPAVEAQATDRAHRIGQSRTVFVHSFIAEGTLEERVDEMLERKTRIAGTLVAGGEKFLRELAPAEFVEICRLS